LRGGYLIFTYPRLLSLHQIKSSFNKWIFSFLLSNLQNTMIQLLNNTKKSIEIGLKFINERVVFVNKEIKMKKINKQKKS